MRNVQARIVEAEAAESRFRSLKELLGADLACFCFCAVNDVPYDPTLPSPESWEAYCHALKGERSKEWFIDGETNVNTVLYLGMNDEERWERVWGSGDPNRPYSKQDYQRLDELWKTYSARLMGAGGMDAQQEDTIRTCCKERLLADRCIAQGTKESVDMAAKLNKTIQDQLAAENLRKKDAKPVENAKVDGIVDALRKKYGVGVELTYEQAIEICAKWMTSHRYPYTMDAAEKALLSIINTIRKNNDQAEMQELPAQFGLFAQRSEFAGIPNDMEEDAYRYLGLSRERKRKGVDSTLGE